MFMSKMYGMRKTMEQEGKGANSSTVVLAACTASIITHNDTNK